MHRVCILVAVLAGALAPSPVAAADPAAVKAAIDRAAIYLRGNSGADSGRAILSALALYKAGVDATDPAIQKAVDSVLEKCSGGKYAGGRTSQMYAVGLEATLLSDLDAEKYQPQLTMMRDYILENQMENGAWDYPDGGHGAGSKGDTSCIQYSCLGLWAIARADIAVPPETWEKVLLWHAQNQGNDGGFAYCPGLNEGEQGGNSSLNMSVNAVGSMHIAMLQLDPSFLPLKANSRPATPKPEVVAEEKPKFGVLETVEVVEEDATKSESAKIPNSSIDSVRRAFGYVTTRFQKLNEETQWKTYYYYSLERMAALANVQMIGDHDWYQECADVILSQQKPDGSWQFTGGSGVGVELDTAFTILFLTRSTGKLLKRTVAEPGFGDGLLAGGRGLPEDLKDVNFDGRGIKGKDKPRGPLEEMLASLQDPEGINIDDLQEQIVDKVQLGDRAALIGQKELLIKLASNPDPAVRQTAMWALGRTDDLRLARHLIDGLSDVNSNVMMEAQNALCWLARRPRGVGLPENPEDAAPDGATPEQRQESILAWRRQALQAWGTWYLENRPYDDQADQFESKLKGQLQRIRSGMEP